LRRFQLGLARNFWWLIQVVPHFYLRTSSRREKLSSFNHNHNHNHIFLCLSLPSSLLFYSSSSLHQLLSIDSTMSYVVAAARNKRKGDLAASFPLVGRCLKCFKHLLIDPDSLCAVAPGKKNCDRCNKGSESCELVSSSPKSEPKLTRFEDSPQPFGGLPGLGRHRDDLQGLA
jgi:hypothetical protein